MGDPSSTSARGYGPAHQRARAEWQAVIDQHGAVCTMPVCLEASRDVPVGAAPSTWDLNHTEDRTGYTGPAHRRCNRAGPNLGPRWTREVQPASQQW